MMDRSLELQLTPAQRAGILLEATSASELVMADDESARVAVPTDPSLCDCLAGAVGRCRLCANTFCRSHLIQNAFHDQAFRTRWEAWTCNNCIEAGRRRIRLDRMQICESASTEMQASTWRKLSTPNGIRLPVVSVFIEERSSRCNSPVLHAQALLVEYCDRLRRSRASGLALSLDGSTVFSIGAAVTGVRRSRVSRRCSGYMIDDVIDLDRLRKAAAGPVGDPWFEEASRSLLRTFGLLRHTGLQ